MNMKVLHNNDAGIEEARKFKGFKYTGTSLIELLGTGRIHCGASFSCIILSDCELAKKDVHKALAEYTANETIKQYKTDNYLTISVNTRNVTKTKKYN